VGLADYIKARSSASYLVSKRLAARKNVDMERAKYDLEEHRLRCVSATLVIEPSPEKERAQQFAGAGREVCCGLSLP